MVPVHRLAGCRFEALSRRHGWFVTLRILVVLNAYAEDGPGRVATALIRQWIKQPGVEVQTVALVSGGKLEQPLETLGVSREVISRRGPGGFPMALQWARRMALAGRRFDIVHTHLARADVYGPWLARRLKARALVSTQHGIHAWKERGEWTGRLYAMLYRHQQRRLNAIVAISEAVARDLVREGIHEDRIRTIPNGVDLKEFRPGSEGDRMELRRLLGVSEQVRPDGSGLVVVSGGNLIPLKGHDVLLRAMPEVVKRFPGVTLLLVGSGRLAGALDTQIRELGLEKNVKRCGSLSKLWPRVVCAADLLVHPSWSEAFGLVVAEAHACAVPVVATRVGGVPEVVEDGVTGYLVDSGNSSGLSRHMIELLENPARRRGMGIAGRARVDHLFAIERTSEQYLKLFRELAPE